ncbi:hypothetical protein PG997_015142 [Apiospora hydei]|uniref:F-box domain-containing protein n=1 Tax=Apiospora hydei TaxID=1337664 RepID=A0ABR1UVU0_9PEZI
MAGILDLPDELLLKLINSLTLESYFCLVRTCQTFRRLSYDASCRQRFDSACSPVLLTEAQTRDSVFLFNMEHPYRPLRDIIQTTMDVFNPPIEYMPPWSPTGRMKTAYRGDLLWGDKFRPKEYDIALHSLCLDMQSYENRRISNIAGLLLKDKLCSTCWYLRGTSDFTRRLRYLMSPVYCGPCDQYHSDVFFPGLAWEHRDSDQVCTGRTGYLRICAHHRVFWDDYQRLSGGYHCKPCRATLVGSSSGSISHRREIKLPQELCRSYPVDQDSLEVIRTSLARCGGGACPHIRINDPSLVTYLLHTLQSYYIVPNVEVPISDPWGNR